MATIWQMLATVFNQILAVAFPCYSLVYRTALEQEKIIHVSHCSSCDVGSKSLTLALFEHL